MKKQTLSKEDEFSVMNVNGLGIVYCEDIYKLDFYQVKQQLQSPYGKRPWSKKKCEMIELAYKRLITLMRMFRHKVLLPTSSIREFWQQHALEKEKYSQDYASVFGYFSGKHLWHEKHQLLQAKKVKQAYEETIRLYQRYFEEDYILPPENQK